AVEATLLAGPVTVFVAYAFPFAFTLGIASIFAPLIDPRVKFDPIMAAAVPGCGAGAFSLFMFWRLVIATIKNRPVQMDNCFVFAVVLGVIAVGCLAMVIKLGAVVFAAIPLTLVTAHFVYLQRQLHAVQCGDKA
ncbi:MAG TPA: hypothetical protein VN019_03160, partial [Oxalicibacterium sp.]|nr:hypothetical protein [Oxalicibacterium sp.]